MGETDLINRKKVMEIYEKRQQMNAEMKSLKSLDEKLEMQSSIQKMIYENLNREETVYLHILIQKETQ